METLLPWILSLVGGAGGGAGAGALLKDKGLGMVGNLLAGGAGGLLGGAGASITSLIPALGGMLGASGGSLVGGGLNGLILTAVIGFVKSKMGSK